MKRTQVTPQTIEKTIAEIIWKELLVRIKMSKEEMEKNERKEASQVEGKYEGGWYKWKESNEET